MLKFLSILTVTFLFTTGYVSSADLKTVEKEHYTLQFPNDWTVNDGGSLGLDLIAKAPDAGEGKNFQENFNVILEKVNQPMSREEYINLSMKNLETLSGFKLDKSEDVSLNGIPGKKLEYSYTIHGNEIKVLQFITFENNLAVIVTFGADKIDYPRLKDAFISIANSLKLKLPATKKN